jgi:hypothetical protein
VKRRTPRQLCDAALIDFDATTAAVAAGNRDGGSAPYLVRKEGAFTDAASSAAAAKLMPRWDIYLIRRTMLMAGRRAADN